MIPQTLILFTLLSLNSIWAEDEATVEGEWEKNPKDVEKQFESLRSSEDAPRRIWVLKNVSTTEDFINEAPICVIGFIKDLESDSAVTFNDVVDTVRNLPFGITSESSVWQKYNITHNTISLFKKFDEGRVDFEFNEGELDHDKIIQFLRQNEMRLVIEYNHMDASQIFGSGIPIHLLLLVSKRSAEYRPLLKQLRTVAPEFRGKVIFILVDTDVKENSRVSTYFKVKETEHPSLCLFHMATEAIAVMKASNISSDSLREFCTNFMEGKDMSIVKPPRPPSEEL
ncbi:endoplasmic reticulum resident protein 27-like isoform X1 [Stegostoma tigrinum]|uniref:endoplasmic reticulum resident protein 27-like isoform X1 n=1 Tax=Stegostoma tigrinum TaxID=3053191 RepID=UPI0028706610|nr:endoplasmic reticulum resident protein 27-like isoform X1 [Stegostoma tigrinum]